MKPFSSAIEEATVTNSYYRKVLYTADNCQVVVMSLKGGEEIGSEVHEDSDQFFRIEEGKARFVFNDKDEREVGHGDAVVVPAGTRHNVINASETKALKLYTIYAPPQHPDGTVHKTKAEADKAEKAEKAAQN